MPIVGAGFVGRFSAIAAGQINASGTDSYMTDDAQTTPLAVDDAQTTILQSSP